MTTGRINQIVLHCLPVCNLSAQSGGAQPNAGHIGLPRLLSSGPSTKSHLECYQKQLNCARAQSDIIIHLPFCPSPTVNSTQPNSSPNKWTPPCSAQFPALRSADQQAFFAPKCYSCEPVLSHQFSYSELLSIA